MSKITEDSTTIFINKYNHTKIKQCNKIIDFCENEINALQIKINKLERIKKDCKKEVYDLCKHEWVIDRSFQDEHTTYICVHCNSYT